MDGRVVGVLRDTSAARLTPGKMRPVESVVKPSRRITKARRTLANCGPWYCYRNGLPPRQQYLPVMTLKCFDYRARS